MLNNGHIRVFAGLFTVIWCFGVWFSRKRGRVHAAIIPEWAQVLYCPLPAPYAAAHMETAVIPGLSRLDEGCKADEPCTIL